MTTDNQTDSQRQAGRVTERDKRGGKGVVRYFKSVFYINSFTP